MINLIVYVGKPLIEVGDSLNENRIGKFKCLEPEQCENWSKESMKTLKDRCPCREEIISTIKIPHCKGSCLKVSIAVINHYNQKQLREGSICFIELHSTG